MDIDRHGPTYTMETLTDLASQFPDHELFFITGVDALAHPVGVTRPGFHLDDEHLPDGAVSLVEVPAMAISSSDCRRRVRAGMPVWYLVPDEVA